MGASVVGTFTAGHDTESDDLFAPAGGSRDGMTPEQRKGQIGNILYNTPAREDWDVGGGGEAVVEGWKQGGTSAYDRSVDRYRGKGEAAQGRGALTLDRTHEAPARGLQMNGLEMLRRQGAGEAPSSAAILSQRANQDAAQQLGAAGLRKGGLGAAIAAQGLAAPGATERAMSANVQGANDRAGEISRAQGQYASGATAMQGQDIAAAHANAQLAAQQRALNEAAQQRYERLGYDTRTTQLQAGVDTEKQRHEEQLSINRARDARSDAEDAANEKRLQAGIEMLSSLTSASDPRTKQNVHPLDMGSLGSLTRSRGRY